MPVRGRNQEVWRSCCAPSSPRAKSPCHPIWPCFCARCSALAGSKLCCGLPAASASCTSFSCLRFVFLHFIFLSGARAQPLKIALKLPSASRALQEQPASTSTSALWCSHLVSSRGQTLLHMPVGVCRKEPGRSVAVGLVPQRIWVCVTASRSAGTMIQDSHAQPALLAMSETAQSVAAWTMELWIAPLSSRIPRRRHHRPPAIRRSMRTTATVCQAS